MDYRKIKIFSVVLSLFVFFTACNNKEIGNVGNTFFVELVNFTNDSLKQQISESIFGKVSYYKNNTLNMVSVNYITESYPDMHVFKPFNSKVEKIEEDTRRIRVEFLGKYSSDSISYSLQKYRYNNGKWNKYSDMGAIKEMNSNEDARNYAIHEYKKNITKNIVEYTYN